MSFLRNVWYVAALPQEIEGEAMFTRRLLDESVLLYRRRDGGYAALRDRCPHRFAPLSMGKRVDDDVVCHYHALRFGASGQCVHNPHGDQKIPAAAKVHSYPLVERDGLIWIWMGDPALADASQIMDCSRLGEGHPNGVGYGSMRFAANYELIVDNILDLSHADHVHGPIINTQGNLTRQIPEVQSKDREVVVHWDWKQTPAQLIIAPHLPNPEGEARQFVDVHWHAPSNIFLTVAAMQGEGSEETRLQTWDFHFMTPETPTSTHYFFASRRSANWLEEDAEYNRMKMAGMLHAFENEDGPIISAVQQEMGTNDFWSLKPVLLTGDPAPVRARRTLEKLIREEAAGTVAVK